MVSGKVRIRGGAKSSSFPFCTRNIFFSEKYISGKKTIFDRGRANQNTARVVVASGRANQNEARVLVVVASGRANQNEARNEARVLVVVSTGRANQNEGLRESIRTRHEHLMRMFSDLE